MKLLDGKATSDQLKTEIAGKVAAIKAAGGRVPHLAAVLVGSDGGSMTYVNNKVLACKACGFDSTLLTYPDTITEAELLALTGFQPGSQLSLDELRAIGQNCDAFLLDLRNEDAADLARTAKARASSGGDTAALALDGVVRDLRAAFGTWSSDTMSVL
jgi:hypothetical protein